MNPEQTHQPIDIPRYEEQEPQPPKRRRGEGMRTFFSTISVILLAIGFAFLLTSFVFQSYQVDGPSMEPTLHDGDRLIIWKVPRTVARITNSHYTPERGDVIVFVEHGSLGPDGNEKQLIKRVIGVPGDHVVVADGEVMVYNDENPDGFNPDIDMPYHDGQPFEMNNNEEDEVIVGQGQLYVLGDNRNNSLDSRFFGPIDTNDVVGKLTLRVFPINQARSF